MMEHAAQPKILLQIDPRGMTPGIVPKLKHCSDIFQCEETRLKTGHYLLDRQILIERKRLPDFLSSIQSGKLFEEAYRLAYSRYRPMMILEEIGRAHV